MTVARWGLFEVVLMIFLGCIEIPQGLLLYSERLVIFRLFRSIYIVYDVKVDASV